MFFVLLFFWKTAGQFVVCDSVGPSLPLHEVSIIPKPHKTYLNRFTTTLKQCFFNDIILFKNGGFGHLVCSCGRGVDVAARLSRDVNYEFLLEDRTRLRTAVFGADSQWEERLTR